LRGNSGELDKLHSGNEGALCNLGKLATASASASSLCAVFVLSSDTATREREMKIAREVAHKFRQTKGIKFAYVDWKTQRRTVDKLLGLHRGESKQDGHRSKAKEEPLLLVFRTKKGKARISVQESGSFNTDALSATMERAVGGDLPLQTVPFNVHFR